MLCLRWLATSLACTLMVLWVLWCLNWLVIGFFWWYEHDWWHLISFLSLRGLPFKFPISYPCSTLTMTLSPYPRLWFLTPLMRFFSLCEYPKLFRMSISIFPRIPKLLSFSLIGFWGLWLFNYPWTSTLTFPILKLLDWHGTKWVPS